MKQNSTLWIFILIIISIAAGCNSGTVEESVEEEENIDDTIWVEYNYDTIRVPEIDWKATLRRMPYLSQMVDTTLAYYLESLEEPLTEDEWADSVRRMFLEYDSLRLENPRLLLLITQRDSITGRETCLIFDVVNSFEWPSLLYAGTAMVVFFTDFYDIIISRPDYEGERRRRLAGCLHIGVRESPDNGNVTNVIVRMGHNFIESPADNYKYISRVVGKTRIGPDSVPCLIYNAGPVNGPLGNVVLKKRSSMDLKIMTDVYLEINDNPIWVYEIVDGNPKLKHSGF